MTNKTEIRKEYYSSGKENIVFKIFTKLCPKAIFSYIISGSSIDVRSLKTTAVKHWNICDTFK
jgi:hypothetical protein